MAGSDDETVELGVTENEERRLCGMAGDDDEDDLREDRDALFGPGADDPINVDDDGPVVPACGGAPPPDGNSAKRSRPSTSPVWDDFEKLFKTTADGKTVRYGARCLHCSKIYSGFSSGGTGHLSRHIASCVKRREKTRMSQSQISFNPDGSMRTWDYCPLVARTQLVRLFARLDVPISMGESEAFEEFIKTAHNPKYARVSRQTTARDIVKYFTECKANLVSTFSTSVNCLCLTSFGLEMLKRTI